MRAWSRHDRSRRCDVISCVAGCTPLHSRHYTDTADNRSINDACDAVKGSDGAFFFLIISGDAWGRLVYGMFSLPIIRGVPSPKNVPLARQIDEVVPSLLVLPAGTDLHDHPMVKDGRLVLQGAPDFYQTHAGVAKFDVIVVKENTLQIF